MPIKPIPKSQENTPYYLICYDKLGNERSDDPHAENGLLSHDVIRTAKTRQYTDIFFISHGWKGDIPAAIDQYNRWTAVMAACENDIQRLKVRPQGFKPLVIGLHWPSLPFGVEEHRDIPPLEDVLHDFAIPPVDKADDWKTQAIESIADTDQERQAVQVIVDRYDITDSPESLDTEVIDAINTLLRPSGQGDQVALPNEDSSETDAENLYGELKAQDSADEDDELIPFGFSSGRGPVSGLLTQLSAWKMKERARTFGENGAAKLLRQLQRETDTSTQYHLMGHSFGTIVVSSTITGKGGHEPLPRPVNTLYLVQGAVSLWSFCKDIPVWSGKPGYYQHLASPKYIAGPILVTHTDKDTAVKTIYPLMAKTSSDEVISFDPTFPKHGAIGMFGVQGKGIAIHHMEMLPLHGNYGFTPRTFFNLEAGNYIKENESTFSGAHNDIDHPEVAHVFLSAIQ